MVDIFHWVHGVVFCLLAVVHAWSWYRGGFWVPGYVHVIALLALIAGVVVTATLPPPANPDPMVRLLFPFVFPVFFVVSTYAVAILFGYTELARKLRDRKTEAPSQEPGSGDS